MKEFKIFICSLLLLSACSVNKKLPFESFSLHPETEKTLLSKVETTENQNRYTQISRFTADYDGINENNSFKGYARIAQDSMLLMSFSAAIGSEVLRVLLSPDTALTLNRLDYTYSRQSYIAADQIIPLPYHLLEALLSYCFSDVLNKNFTLSIKDKMYLMEEDINKNTYVAYMIDSNYFVRKFIYKNFISNTIVSVKYNSFLDIDGTKFPQNIEVVIQNRTESGVLKLEVKKVEFKDKITFPFTISSRYTRSY